MTIGYTIIYIYIYNYIIYPTNNFHSHGDNDDKQLSFLGLPYFQRIHKVFPARINFLVNSAAATCFLIIKPTGVQADLFGQTCT